MSADGQICLHCGNLGLLDYLARYWSALVLGKSSGAGSKHLEPGQLPFKLSGRSRALLDKDATARVAAVSLRDFLFN